MLPGHIDDPEQAVVVVLGCVYQLSFFFWLCIDHGLWLPLFAVKVRGIPWDCLMWLWVDFVESIRNSPSSYEASRRSWRAWRSAGENERAASSCRILKKSSHQWWHHVFFLSLLCYSKNIKGSIFMVDLAQCCEAEAWEKEARDQSRRCRATWIAASMFRFRHDSTEWFLHWHGDMVRNAQLPFSEKNYPTDSSFVFQVWVMEGKMFHDYFCLC